MLLFVPLGNALAAAANVGEVVADTVPGDAAKYLTGTLAATTMPLEVGKPTTR